MLEGTNWLVEKLMLIDFLFRKHLLKWVGLFVSVIVSVFLLAHALNRSEFLFSASPENPALATASDTATDAIALSSLQPQAKYERNLAHYAIVSRSDGSFRKMFVDENSLAVIQAGEPLPDGTLIVMETWYSPENLGTVFVKQKRDGQWRYGSFNPARPDYQMRFRASCHICHAPFSKTDFTFTKPLLEAALRTQKVQAAYCDRPGRTPCTPQAYLPDES